jgi:hypothetical protein
MTGYKNRSRPQACRMTRAHFEAIAETLRAACPNRVETAYAIHARLQWRSLVQDFARMCAASNDGFKLERFYRACGLGD